MLIKNFIINFKSEILFFLGMAVLLTYLVAIMLPVSTHGEVNPICEMFIDKITCTTSP